MKIYSANAYPSDTQYFSTKELAQAWLDECNKNYFASLTTESVLWRLCLIGERKADSEIKEIELDSCKPFIY